MKMIMTVFFFFPILAFSHTYKSETFCSDETKEACAHIGYDNLFDTMSAFEFVFHVTTPGAENIENVVVYLAMPEANLVTEAVVAEKVGPGKFLVKNAYFPAPGVWEIRAEFDFKLFHQIFIPVLVK